MCNQAKNTNSNKKIIGVQVNEEMLDKINKLADKYFISTSAAIRLIISEYFREKEKVEQQED